LVKLHLERPWLELLLPLPLLLHGSGVLGRVIGTLASATCWNLAREFILKVGRQAGVGNRPQHCKPEEF
jgi:hypothetical protein